MCGFNTFLRDDGIVPSPANRDALASDHDARDNPHDAIRLGRPPAGGLMTPNGAMVGKTSRVAQRSDSVLSARGASGAVRPRSAVVPAKNGKRRGRCPHPHCRRSVGGLVVPVRVRMWGRDDRQASRLRRADEAVRCDGEHDAGERPDRYVHHCPTPPGSTLFHTYIPRTKVQRHRVAHAACLAYHPRSINHPQVPAATSDHRARTDDD